MKKTLILMLLMFTAALNSAAEEAGADVTVFKSPTCGCCTIWASHLRENGFTVNEKKVDNVGAYKQQFGVPAFLSSCHTALVGGYVIEGHVPASEIRRLLQEKPDIRGLTVPGMVAGSPGMEQGGRQDSFNVLAIRKDGSTYIYKSYDKK